MNEHEVRCEKCGEEITTGLMAVFCKHAKDCAFYVPTIEDFQKDWIEPVPEMGEEL